MPATARVQAVAATLVGAALPGALIAVTVLRGSSAAFSDETSNAVNSWQTGIVNISDNDSGAALFDAARDGRLTGGQTLTRCIKVTYEGDGPAAVRLYAYGLAGDLAPYLGLTVETGTGAATGGSCSGFSPAGAPVVSGTLAGFAADHGGYAIGADPWSAAPAEARTYRFTTTVSEDDAAQGKATQVGFRWEARG